MIPDMYLVYYIYRSIPTMRSINIDYITLLRKLIVIIINSFQAIVNTGQLPDKKDAFGSAPFLPPPPSKGARGATQQQQQQRAESFAGVGVGAAFMPPHALGEALNVFQSYVHIVSKIT